MGTWRGDGDTEQDGAVVLDQCRDRTRCTFWGQHPHCECHPRQQLPLPSPHRLKEEISPQSVRAALFVPAPASLQGTPPSPRPQPGKIPQTALAAPPPAAARKLISSFG